MKKAKPFITPINLTTEIDIDERGKRVDITMYEFMARSLFYLIASKLDIMFSVCMYARFQANLEESHLVIMKKILRYLTYSGIWYYKASSSYLIGFFDIGFAGNGIDQKSTSETC